MMSSFRFFFKSWSEKDKGKQNKTVGKLQRETYIYIFFCVYRCMVIIFIENNKDIIKNDKN